MPSSLSYAIEASRVGYTIYGQIVNYIKTQSFVTILIMESRQGQEID